MNKFVTALAFSCLGLWAESMSGTIQCPAAHPEKSTSTVKTCEGGADPVFVAGDKVFKIANPDQVQKHIGQKIRISGTVAGDTVTIQKTTLPK